MLTGCGSATIKPEIIPEHVTDGIVDVRDLPSVPTRPRDVIGSGILIVPPEGFNKPDLRDEHEIPKIPETNTFQIDIYRRGGDDSENPDGFAKFRTGIPQIVRGKAFESASGMVLIPHDTTIYAEPFYYIGILSTTNLGAPLIEAPTTAIWPGHFYTLRLGNRPADFYVDFAVGRFGFHNGMEGDASGIGTRDNTWGGAIGASGVVTNELDGYFGNHPNAEGFSPGQMTGTFTSDWTNIDSTVFSGYFKSTLIGLIGEEGVVGVFGADIGTVSSDGRPALTGGFTATNPDYTPPAEN